MSIKTLIDAQPSPGHWAIRLRMKHLLMLGALQRTGSVRRAAQSLHMTQPAASKMLADVEKIFGVRMFVRSAKGLAITDSGALIAERAAHLLNDLMHVREAATEAASGAVGIVRVGVLPVAIPTVVADAVVALHTRAPHLRIELVESSSSQLLPALRRGEFDCVIGRLAERPPPTDLDRTILYREAVCVVGRLHHPLAGARQVGLSQATKWPWVLPSGRTPLREFLESAWEQAGLKAPPCTLETVSVQAVVSVLCKTNFLAVMPMSTAALFLDASVLSRIKLKLSWEPPPIEVMTLRLARPPMALQHFIEEVRRVAAVLG